MPRLKKQSEKQRRLKVREAQAKYREKNPELDRQRNREALALKRSNEEYRIEERRKARYIRKLNRIRLKYENRKKLLHSDDTVEQPIIKQELPDICSEIDFSYSINNTCSTSNFSASCLNEGKQGNSGLINDLLIKTEIKIEPTQIFEDYSTYIDPNINPADFLSMQSFSDNDEANQHDYNTMLK